MKVPRWFEEKKHVQVKICGITNAEDARISVGEGASAIGINFFPGSKRYVDLQIAEKIVEFADSGILRIGVTVNADFDKLSSIWNSGVVDMFQFHGTEDAEYLRTARENDWPFFVAKRVQTREEAINSIDDMFQNHVSAILLDSYVPGELGGTGHKIDWEQLTGLFTKIDSMTCILAGGLNPGNVHEAIRLTSPHFVDVASGVEESPRKKSREGIISFIKEVQRAGNVR